MKKSKSYISLIFLYFFLLACVSTQEYNITDIDFSEDIKSLYIDNTSNTIPDTPLATDFVSVLNDTSDTNSEFQAQVVNSQRNQNLTIDYNYSDIPSNKSTNSSNSNQIMIGIFGACGVLVIGGVAIGIFVYKFVKTSSENDIEVSINYSKEDDGDGKTNISHILDFRADNSQSAKHFYLDKEQITRLSNETHNGEIDKLKNNDESQYICAKENSYSIYKPNIIESISTLSSASSVSLKSYYFDIEEDENIQGDQHKELNQQKEAKISPDDNQTNVKDTVASILNRSFNESTESIFLVEKNTDNSFVRIEAIDCRQRSRTDTSQLEEKNLSLKSFCESNINNNISISSISKYLSPTSLNFKNNEWQLDEYSTNTTDFDMMDNDIDTMIIPGPNIQPNITRIEKELGFLANKVADFDASISPHNAYVHPSPLSNLALQLLKNPLLSSTESSEKSYNSKINIDLVSDTSEIMTPTIKYAYKKTKVVGINEHLSSSAATSNTPFSTCALYLPSNEYLPLMNNRIPLVSRAEILADPIKRRGIDEIEIWEKSYRKK